MSLHGALQKAKKKESARWAALEKENVRKTGSWIESFYRIENVHGGEMEIDCSMRNSR